jgi:hypothetical protein
MSYDIFVQDLPADAAKVEDIPATFKPATLGRRSEIIRQIEKVVPTAEFSNPAWGCIRGDDWSIEVNIGTSDECFGFALHVRGGDEAFGVVAAILQGLSLRALDPQAGGFFVANPAALESFRKWRAYRDQVVGDSQPAD